MGSTRRALVSAHHVQASLCEVRGDSRESLLPLPSLLHSTISKTPLADSCFAIREDVFQAHTGGWSRP